MDCLLHDGQFPEQNLYTVNTIAESNVLKVPIFFATAALLA